MIIGIDGNEANVEKKVGVSVYTLKLLEYFAKQAKPELKFRIFLRNLPLFDLPQTTDYFQYEVVAGKYFWSQFFLPLALLKNKFSKNRISVFFSPAHYAPRYSPCPVITTVHDLSYFHYPNEFLKKDLYQLKNWTEYSVRQSKKVICVSQTTKKDLIKYYAVPEEKIEVVYNGFEKDLQPRTNNQEPTTYNLQPHKYLLYVGTIQPRKNILALVKAFGLFREKYPDFKLVIAGKKGWLYEDLYREINNTVYQDKIIFTDFISDNQLVDLYKNAFSYVLPSLYEGFGIPVLEAMSYGCPAICSYTSSLPEIAGDAALYFDPENFQELAEKLTILKENKELRNELIKKGKERTKKFSWEKCGEETLNILKKYDQNHR